MKEQEQVICEWARNTGEGMGGRETRILGGEEGYENRKHLVGGGEDRPYCRPTDSADTDFNKSVVAVILMR